MIDLAKKARAKNMTPMSLGVGDRPYPGAYLVQESMLKKLGIQEYDNLLKGKLSWTDPRVLDTLRLIRSWTEAGCCRPRSPPSSWARRTATSTPTRAR